jgi:S1-C subfamily serine protease
MAHLDSQSTPIGPRGIGFITIALLLLSAFLLGLVAKEWIQGAQRIPPAPRPIAPRADLGQAEQDTIGLVNKVSPSVVYVATSALRRAGLFSMNVYKIPRGTGSGFIWDDSGHIVTNYHVIAGSDAADVTLVDGSVLKASLVGHEIDKDLAVLKIDAPQEKLIPIEVGESGNLQVGQHVMAIGNPFGLDYTCTTGIIGGLGREIESENGRPIQGVIQTDAAINPGNSGGPLVDSAGRLIGINTAIYSPTGTSAGIGFAVPVDTVNRIVPQLIQYRRVIKPDLGVELLNDATNRRHNIHGVGIFAVRPGSGAEAAGLRGLTRERYGYLRLGDVILAINGNPVQETRDIYRILDNHKVGDVVSIKIQRGQTDTSVKVRLSQDG